MGKEALVSLFPVKGPGCFIKSVVGGLVAQQTALLAERLGDNSPQVAQIIAPVGRERDGGLDALHVHNLQVPTDIALVGYDETYWAALGSLSLTTVVQSAYELGCAAALRLFQHLQNPAIQSRQEVILAPSLVVRGSTLPKDVRQFKAQA